MALGGRLCALLKASVPKIDKDQLHGVQRLLSAQKTLDLALIEHLCEKPTLTATRLREYLDAYAAHPECWREATTALTVPDPALLEAQLRALLAVSRQCPLGLLIPLVTFGHEVAHVRAELERLAATLGVERPRLGAMIETPAAAWSVSELKAHVDFFSIGSNDLTQYTLAAGRENPLVTDDFRDDHPVILRLIAEIVRAAGDTPVSLCGELAGRTARLPRLLDTGLRALSVPAPRVAEVKEAIRKTRLDPRAGAPPA